MADEHWPKLPDKSSRPASTVRTSARPEHYRRGRADAAGPLQALAQELADAFEPATQVLRLGAESNAQVAIQAVAIAGDD